MIDPVNGTEAVCKSRNVCLFEDVKRLAHTSSTLNGLAERVQHWLDNGGREELEAALKRGRQESARIRKVLQVDYETLSQPCTI